MLSCTCRLHLPPAVPKTVTCAETEPWSGQLGHTLQPTLICHLTSRNAISAPISMESRASWPHHRGDLRAGNGVPQAGRRERTLHHRCQRACRTLKALTLRQHPGSLRSIRPCPAAATTATEQADRPPTCRCKILRALMPDRPPAVAGCPSAGRSAFPPG